MSEHSQVNHSADIRNVQYKEENLRLGNPAINPPQMTSIAPIIRRYHFEGTLMSNNDAIGNAFAYLT